MTHNLKFLFLFFLLSSAAFAQGDASGYQVVYKGDKGPGLDKNIVFIATDHEYRSEESLPALARIMAKRYGFTCTVIWGLDDEGNILPGSSNLKGLEVLDKADLLVMFMRFAHFEDKEMQHIDKYIRRGGPIVAFRTSTHAFEIKNDPKWEHYTWNYKGDKTAWKDGFGEVVLGETWVSHYGTNHKQSSKLIIEQSEAAHPIMTGVKDVWVESGGYTAEPKGTVLARGQVLNGMTATSAPYPTKELLPVAWIKEYQVEGGSKGKSFTTTHGASEDLLNEGFRRMAVNAMFWGLGMEKSIKPTNNIAFVGPYKPTTFNFSGYKANVKPADLAGFDSLIMPGKVVKKKAP
ncbi:ThuA domain-containing protein [Dyadobacter sp. Leaf189]|uniref:ThuA domain-containing protein n=1 Tax=Dyadobacter sp. Leaf189 TaxID=1736295 RepID=UPI0006F258D1|nr:ThuA domain-containing protein [Dyadobacter sp. Leaf189]KQS24810.1 hypothetical protein ASG33_23960 [Dyadobacter sp. Leaf189]